MANICPDPRAFNASHQAMRAQGINSCPYCSISFTSRTDSHMVETLILDDDGKSFSVGTSAFKPSAKTLRLDTTTRTEADILAAIPRRPAPPPLHPRIKQEDSSYKTTGTIIPAAITRPIATPTYIDAATVANQRMEESIQKTRTSDSSTAFFHFKVYIHYTKWVSDKSKAIRTPTYVQGTKEDIGTYLTSPKQERIFSMHDWWERIGKKNFVRAEQYPSVMGMPIEFFMKFTNRSFINFTDEQVQAKSIRTMWEHCMKDVKQDNNEYHAIHVVYKDIHIIEAFDSFESDGDNHTSLTEISYDSSLGAKRALGIKREPGIKQEEAISYKPPTSKRKASTSTLSPEASRYRTPLRPSPRFTSSDDDEFPDLSTALAISKIQKRGMHIQPRTPLATLSREKGKQEEEGEQEKEEGQGEKDKGLGGEGSERGGRTAAVQLQHEDLARVRQSDLAQFNTSAVREAGWVKKPSMPNGRLLFSSVQGEEGVTSGSQGLSVRISQRVNKAKRRARYGDE